MIARYEENSLSYLKKSVDHSRSNGVENLFEMISKMKTRTVLVNWSKI